MPPEAVLKPGRLKIELRTDLHEFVDKYFVSKGVVILRVLKLLELVTILQEHERQALAFVVMCVYVYVRIPTSPL